MCPPFVQIVALKKRVQLPAVIDMRWVVVIPQKPKKIKPSEETKIGK